MRIALCVNAFSPSVGGCEVVVGKIAEYYAQDHEVCVFTRHLLKRKEKRIGSVEVVSYNPSNVSSFLLRIKKFNPDFTLVYSDVFDFLQPVVENLSNVCVAFCGANRFYNKPYTLNLFKRHLSSVSSFVCHTKSERDYRLAAQLGVLDKTHVIPLGVDLDEFDNDLSREDLVPGSMKDDLWVLNVSNFFPGKGQLHLVDILHRTKTRPLTYVQICSSLDFALGKHLEQQWRAKANQLSSEGIRVILMKDKSREKVVAAFKNSNVFVFPSEKESGGIVLLESMAAGTPWVASNIGIAPDICGGYCLTAAKDGNYNAIFDERIKSLFANRIDDCFDWEKSGQLIEEGSKDVEKYQWKSILPLYKRLLK